MEITEKAEVTEAAETIEETERIPEGGAPDGDPAATPALAGEPDGGHPSGADGNSDTTDGDPAATPALAGEPDGGHPSGADGNSDTTDGDPAATPALAGEPDGGHPSGAPDAEEPGTEEVTGAGESASFSAEELFQEITKLKERLDHAEKERSRIAGEIAEFRTLYPDVSPNSLSTSVWDAFSRGVPLAASFALEERYRTRAAELVKATDERNRESASPSAGRSVPTGFYSPEEVRAMSSLEVRTHYAAILDSMKHWDR